MFEWSHMMNLNLYASNHIVEEKLSFVLNISGINPFINFKFLNEFKFFFVCSISLFLNFPILCFSVLSKFFFEFHPKYRKAKNH